MALKENHLDKNAKAKKVFFKLIHYMNATTSL